MGGETGAPQKVRSPSVELPVPPQGPGKWGSSGTPTPHSRGWPPVSLSSLSARLNLLYLPAQPTARAGGMQRLRSHPSFPLMETAAGGEVSLAVSACPSQPPLP